MAGVLFLALALLSCKSPLSLIGAILVHEAGHLIPALLFGWGFPAFRFSAAGIRLSYSGTHSAFQSLFVCLSGSAAGAALALLPSFPQEFRYYSLGFSAVSLLPVLCLDGGAALLEALELFMLPDLAYKAASTVSVITVLLFWALSVTVQLKTGVNMTLLLLSVYLTVTSLSQKE